MYCRQYPGGGVHLYASLPSVVCPDCGMATHTTRYGVIRTFMPACPPLCVRIAAWRLTLPGTVYGVIRTSLPAPDPDFRFSS